MQASAGLAYLTGTEPGRVAQIAIVAMITLSAAVSVSFGLRRGIQRLSNANVVLATGLLLFVLVAGPGASILGLLIRDVGNYMLDLPGLANWGGRKDTLFLKNWTHFYWAWWIAWAPFVGMFIARISKGRTVREFVVGVVAAPFGAAVLWICVFGETAIAQYDAGKGDIADGVSDLSMVLFSTLANLPAAALTSTISLILVVLFITTSADSGALVANAVTRKGKEVRSSSGRLFWALFLGLTGSALLVGGGKNALQALQAASIIAGTPFALILIAACGALLLEFRNES